MPHEQYDYVSRVDAFGNDDAMLMMLPLAMMTATPNDDATLMMTATPNDVAFGNDDGYA